MRGARYGRGPINGPGFDLRGMGFMSIKWKVILVIFPSTLLAFYGACALWTGLSSSYSELVAALVTAPRFGALLRQA
jgi:hypothetical protein